MTVEAILSAGLNRAANAGVLGVRAKYLTEGELDELLLRSYDFLWEHRTAESPTFDGWWLSAGGIRPWWEKEAELNERQALSVRPLRTEVYDLLEERGLIYKGKGNVVPIHVAPPPPNSPRGQRASTETITVTQTGAGYGDPETNGVVEKAAMDIVTAAYAERGWIPTDVSADKVGWDITMIRGAETLHVEVKGVSGAKPHILLTRNEHAKAQEDRDWRLAVVTSALTDATLHEYVGADVVSTAVPHVYRAPLN